MQVWTLLLFILPAGIFVAWMAVKKPVTTNLLQPAVSAVLPVIIQSVIKENYTVNLRTDTKRSLMQLEWINKSSLTSPSALIYKLTNPAAKDISENDLIGRIDTKGIFHFPLKNDSTNNNRFILYDFIHRKIIDSINFKP